METIESLQRQIRTAEDLHSLVRTMKALAAVNIRQLEHAVRSLGDYRQTIELGMRVVLRAAERSPFTALRAPRETLGAVVFGSDQGMCGQLNDQISDFSLRQIREASIAVENLVVLAVGGRVAARLQDAGQPLEHALPIAGSASGITPLVQDLLVHIEGWHQERRIDRIVVFFCEHTSRASYQVQRQELLPLDSSWMESIRQQPWPTHVLPTFTMDPDRLFSSLVRQYLFVSLYRACAESLASENASRLAAMRGAERNIGDRLTELTSRFHQTRQMAITEELLDIASGFEALGTEVG